MSRGAPLAALLLLFGAGASLAGDITSAKPDAVAVTIYRDRPMRAAELAGLGDDDTHGLALVVETRTVDVPAGRSRLRFEGVADGIVPQSAGVEGLPAPIIERDFDYNLLTPGSLIAASVGQTVRVVRTERRTGREAKETAVIRSGPDGVVLDVGGRIEALRCSGGAERLVFDQAPAGLTARPTLSLAIDAPVAGRYTVRLSYLTVRMDWSADYIARVAADGRSLALTGWITLVNRTATAFENAPTQVVAGNLARVPVDIPEADAPELTPACWPGQTTHSGWARAMARVMRMAAIPPAPAPMLAGTDVQEMIVVTAEKRVTAIESQLGDYKLYSLAEPTTVAARQTKQVLFLDQPAVKFETVYAHSVTGLWDADGGADSQNVSAANVVLRLKNTSAEGLGRPLPAGTIQVRQPQAQAGGRELLVGEPPLRRDTPVGEPFEIETGKAFDVTIRSRHVSSVDHADGGARDAYEVVVTNARAVPVTTEIRHPRGDAEGFRVIAESARHGLKAGDPLWRLTLPARAQRTLTYTVDSTGP